MPRAEFRLSLRAKQVLRALVPVVCEPDASKLGLVEPILGHVELTLRSFPRGPRCLIVAGIYVFNAAATMSPPFGRSFSYMPRRAARRYFDGWWGSPQYARRRIARALKGLLVLGYYEQPDIHHKLGYNPEQWISRTAQHRREMWSADVERHERLVLTPYPLIPSPLPATNAMARQRSTVVRTRHEGRGVDLECDVVVVGSGAGGAVVAAELAEGGLGVIVIEEGGYHRSEEFTAEATAMVRKLYRDGGVQMTFGTPSISFSEGRCVGGSTTVNGGMCWRTPERVLERWSRESKVARISPAEMERYFRRVERLVSAAHQDEGTIGRDQEILREGAERQGWRVIPNIRNQVHCGGCNNCVLGCPTGAKRSTLVSYIPRALEFGAQVYANRRVERVVMKGKQAVGVEGHIVGEEGRGDARFVVRARWVVLAAGAIQTPALLLRSGVRAPSRRIGKGLSLHPNAVVVAIFDESVEGWKGVHQAYQVRQFQDEGIIMGAVNLPPPLLAMAIGRYGADLGEVMGQYNRIVSAGVLVEDTSSGSVRLLPNGQPAAFYDLSERDAATVVRGTALLAEMLFAAGARKVIVPFEGVPDLASADDARKLRTHKVPAGAIELSTVHVMGTASMGGDPLRHVCDSYGRVYDTDGLYVSDASLFPSPIGINPMETIMALATRNAERILETWKL